MNKKYKMRLQKHWKKQEVPDGVVGLAPDGDRNGTLEMDGSCV